MDSPVPSGSRTDALALEQELGRIMREKRAREKAPKSHLTRPTQQPVQRVLFADS